MFSGRSLVIATMHKKEAVIAPILEQELGVTCRLSINLDTDLLGTFTGEIERSDDPIKTARKKCMQAMELSKCNLGVASEGSFGPHPFLYFVPTDEEILIFIDSKNNLEIVVKELSVETNFSGMEIKSEEELKIFAEKTQFPSHGLILRKHNNDYRNITKGIVDWHTLINTYYKYKEIDGMVYVETDMRAMYNPTRMKVIERTTLKLVEKINSKCPFCDKPGFGITEVKKGLPCELCKFPTRSILSNIYTCKNCYYTYEDKYPNSKLFESAMFCDICNP